MANEHESDPGQPALTPIKLWVRPKAHDEVPTITGSVISQEAGTVLYGHYGMDYDLPGGDRLCMRANHNKSSVQLFLLTSDPEKLRKLPGKRPSSLVANSIASLNRYLIRASSYAQPLSDEQQAKYNATLKAIEALSLLLEEERSLTAHNWSKQERLRTKVLKILEKCRDKNRLIANNPVVSEGALGDLLYNSKQHAQHYEFNRVHPVSKLDQMDFSDLAAQDNEERPPCFVWDSELHIGYDELALQDSFRVICQMYDLDIGRSLTNQAANRFQRLRLFVKKLWRNSAEWANSLAQSNKPEHERRVEKRNNGISITSIQPWYQLKGLSQRRHDELQDMISYCTDVTYEGYTARDPEHAARLLANAANGRWASITGTNQVIIRMQDRMVSLRYGEEQGQVYCLPNGDDLFELNRLSKKHLFLYEKISLGIRAFFSRVPLFFKYIYNSLRHTVTVELRDDFTQHVHGNHPKKPVITRRVVRELPEQPTPDTQLDPASLRSILSGHGLMSDGQSLEQFIQKNLTDNRYIIAREEHPPSPEAYNNPLHRSLGVTRHFASFFVDISERNPIVGTLAMAAYAYGLGAIIAPKVLIALLTKLHLKGLICAIEPTQTLGKWLSNGTVSEAMSAATIYWQGMIIAGDLDNFFIEAIAVLRDNPAEVAIITSLALALGYGLCKAIPTLQEEMGLFPYANYMALGLKGGVALHSTIMHPGDDWFLGSLKWILRCSVTVGKLLVAPFVEAWHYGWRDGFLSGWRKSGHLLVRTIKQSLAATIDALLLVLTIPFNEITALFLHVPFRGITNFISRALGLAGHWQPVGKAMLGFATRSASMNYMPGFHFSHLYGFSNPFRIWVRDNQFLNALVFMVMIFALPLAQLAMSLVILPLIDGLSLSYRLLATFAIDPVSRLVAYTAGKALVLTGFVWDNSFGFLFRSAAEGVTRSSNWLDNKAATVKQGLMEKIQVARRAIYHWAFAKEDLKVHHTNNNSQYFLNDPMLMERLPHKHDSTHCLLSALLTRRPMRQAASDLRDSHQHNWRRDAVASNDDDDDNDYDVDLTRSNP